MAALDTRSAWRSLVQAARARVGIQCRDGAAGDSRLRDRRRALSERRVHAARAVGLAAAAAAGRPTARSPRADFRWPAPGWRCCQNSRSAPPYRVRLGPPSGRPRSRHRRRNSSSREEVSSQARPRRGSSDGDQVVMTRHRVATGFRELVSRPARQGWLAFSLAAVLAASACTTEAEKAATPAASAAVQIRQENVVPVTQGTIVVGPILSGELRPARGEDSAPSSAGRCSRCTSRKRRP